MLASGLNKSNGVWRYFASTIWLSIEKGVRFGVAFLFGLLIARHLGPVEYGQYSFVLAIASVFCAFAGLGVVNIVSRDLVSEFSDRPQTMTAAVFVVTIGGIFSYCLLAIFIHIWAGEEFISTLVMLVGITVFFQTNYLYETFYVSITEVKIYTIASLISISISGSVKIAILLNDAPLKYFVISAVFDVVVFNIILFGSVLRHGGVLGIRHLFLGKMYSILSQSWPYIISGLFAIIFIRIDILMIRQLLGDHSAGIYSAASRVSEAWYIIPMTVVQALYPAIVRAKNYSESKYIERIKGLYSLMICMGLAISVVVSIYSFEIIGGLFGDEFIEASSVLYVHIWSCVFIFLGVSSNRWLLTEKLQYYTIYSNGIGALVNVGLNLILIPIYGVVGAAFATLVSYAISGYFVFLLWPKTRKNFFYVTESFKLLPVLRVRL